MYEPYITGGIIAAAFILYSYIFYACGYSAGEIKKYNDFVYEIELGYLTYNGKVFNLVERT